ncbi:hypothetical protein ACQ4PT_058406 [Festuca glaucescens]
MAALMTAAAAVALLMLLASLAATDRYDQETRRIFAEWKAKYGQTYEDVGEEECRYAVFKDTRRRVGLANAAGIASSGLNGLSGRSREEIPRGKGIRTGEASYEEETRLVFARWKARYGKTYRDAGEEECRYKLFKGNQRIVVQLNAAAAAAGEAAYGLNQLGDLTNEEVRACCDPEMEGKLGARCQAAAADRPDTYLRLIRSQVCWCIAMELKQSRESGGSAIPRDGARMWI